MTEFNEAQSTNDYLISELIIARKENEVLKAHIAELLTDIRIGANYLTHVLRTGNERI
jgi:hypothetical protein